MYITDFSAVIRLGVTITLLAVPIIFGGGYILYKYKVKRSITRFDFIPLGSLSLISLFLFGFLELLSHFMGPPLQGPIIIPSLLEDTAVSTLAPANNSDVVYRDPKTNTIWIRKINGENKRQIYDRPIVEYTSPLMSPDGSTIAFFNNENEVSAYDINSGQLVVLFHTIPSIFYYSLRWSPNSQYIAVSDRQMTRIVRKDGSGEFKINLPDGSLVWSPDSKSFAIYYQLEPEIGEGSPSFSDVSTYDMQGTTLRHSTLTGTIIYEGGKFWSPLNQRMYFTRSGNGIGIYALYSSNVDGSDETLLAGNTDNPPYISNEILSKTAIYGAGSIDFSSDGKRLIVARQVINNLNKFPLWILSLETLESKSIPLPIVLEYISSVQWLSDGNHIIFTTYNGSKEDMYLTDSNGTNPIRLSLSN